MYRLTQIHPLYGREPSHMIPCHGSILGKLAEDGYLNVRVTAQLLSSCQYKNPPKHCHVQCTYLPNDLKVDIGQIIVRSRDNWKNKAFSLIPMMSFMAEFGAKQAYT